MSIELKQAAQQALEALTFIRRKLKSWDRGDSVIDALRTALARHPATPEPVKVAPYNPTEEMRWAMKRIDPALSSEQCRALWSAAWSATPSTHPAPSAAVTPEPVEDGIRNAVDELNCAEEVLDAITCEFSEGEFPVTDFNCIGDYITAVVDVFKERLAAQQPATGEPVASRNPFASRCYAMSESHLSGHRLIVGFEKLGDVQDAHEWVARQGRGDFAHPATGESVGQVSDLFPSVRNKLHAQGLDADAPLYTHPAPSVPDEKPLPDLMMASYHEAIGWNACRAAMLAAKDSK